MNRLRAVSAGVRAETQRFSARVHSTFARACNLELDDGRMLALLGTELGNAPNAVSLETPAGFVFDRSFHRGERVACRAGVMRTERSRVAIRLGQARPWRVDVDRLAADLRRPAVAAAWRATRLLLSRNLTAQTVQSGLPPDRVRALWDATRAVDVGSAVRAASALIGCGVDLTPAGDDILVGMLAGLRASAHGVGERYRLRKALEGAARSGATTPVSGTFLLHAADGEFAEPLARLVTAIARGAPPETVSHAARTALAVGSTSGGDGVRGLLLGLGAWRRPLL